MNTPPRTPEQLRAAIRRLKAELDYPASGTYTRYCREQIERLERELAALKTAEAGKAAV